MTEAKIKATAYHEAGHAVASFVLGRRIDRVSIVPDEAAGNLGHVRGRVLADSEKLRAEIFEFDTLRERKAAEDLIVVLLAGQIAERHLTGRRNRVGAASDDAGVGALVEALHGLDPGGRGRVVALAFVRYLDALAVEIVEDYWFLVEAVAAALIERKALSGVATHRVIRDAIRSEASARFPEMFVAKTVSGFELPPLIDGVSGSAGWRKIARIVAVERGAS